MIVPQMGARLRIVVAVSVSAAALVACVGLGSAASPAFCLAAKPAVQKNLGVGKPLKVFDYEGGVWCSYGSKGPYVQRVPGISKAKFKAKAGSGKPVPGLGGPAYFAPAFGGYFTVSTLKGTTELVVGARSSEQKIVAATKAILPLLP